MPGSKQRLIIVGSPPAAPINSTFFASPFPSQKRVSLLPCKDTSSPLYSEPCSFASSAREGGGRAILQGKRSSYETRAVLPHLSPFGAQQRDVPKMPVSVAESELNRMKPQAPYKLQRAP